MKPLRVLPVVLLALLISTLAGAFFGDHILHADRRGSWSYQEALRFFRAGGSLTPELWKELNHPVKDAESLRNLTLANLVNQLAIVLPDEPGAYPVLVEPGKEVISPESSFSLDDGAEVGDLRQFVVFAYDTPVTIRFRGVLEDMQSAELAVGNVLLISGSGIEIVNASKDRTATVTYQELPGQGISRR